MSCFLGIKQGFMDFEIPEDYRTLKNSVRQFCEKNVKPFARDWDVSEECPRAVLEELGQLGLMGVCVAEEYNGSGLGVRALAVAVEEIARWDGSLALTVAAHNGLCSNHIRLFGNAQQKKKYLPKLAVAEFLGAWALTEAGSGSDSAAMKTTAVRKEGGWVLNGNKMFITQGTQADIFVVLAVTEPQKRQKGISAFLVDGGTEGLVARKICGKMGMRSSDTAELILEDVKVGEEALLGELNQGFIQTMKVLDRGRIIIGALASGLARCALEESLLYSSQRIAFGRAISEFQAVNFKLADMKVGIDAGWGLIWKAAYLADQGRPFSQEAAIAKLYASEAATRACLDAIQILGGNGYTNAFVVERALRDAKLCEIGEGTSEILRLVISRHLLKS